jgi:hypothetical protein
MPSRDRYLEAEEQIRLVRYALADRNLSAERRKALQDHELTLSVVLTRPLLPISWARRGLMMLILVFGLQQIWGGHYEASLWWLLLPLFSPRLSAEVYGRLAALGPGHER